jgi:two-component system sensor histidine kinase QseC
MTRSLQWRLLLHTSVATTAVLAMMGFAVYFCVQRSLYAEFDKALLVRARALAANIEQSGQHVNMDFDSEQMAEFAARKRPDYFQVWLDDGSIVSRSPSLGNRDLPHIDPRQPTFVSLILPDRRNGRALTITLAARPENEDEGPKSPFATRLVTLAIATETTSLDETLQNLRWLLAGVCGSAILLTGAVLMAVVRHAVMPVQRVAADIEALKETDLSVRLAAGVVPPELAPVVEKLNGLLARLESAFTREKSFTADVAHELRTPLAGLQTTLEVCRSRPREPAAYIAAIDRCRAMIDRMQAMIESLLLLARTESGQLPVENQPVEIGPFLVECWSPFQGRAQARRVQIDWPAVPSIITRSDRERLRLAIGNIFDNAVSYVDDGGAIRVGASQTSTAIIIEIANTGSRVEAGDEAHLFERFWRGDPSRTDTGLHCGLGLSLCQRLLRLLNGTISVEANAGGWFIARIVMPIDPAGTAAPRTAG